MGEVISLDDTPANDVVKMLRLTADRIDNGDLPETNLACFVMQSEDDIYIFGWGEEAVSKAKMYLMVSTAQNLILET